MSHIHLIGGEKGGVGKSVVARLLAQWFIDQSVPFAAVDGDASQGTLIRHYGDFAQPVDLSSTESADEIVDRALGADRRVVVDLPAQSARALQAWIASANILDFAKEMSIGLTLWHVTDGGFASVVELERSLALFDKQLTHVVVKNHGRSKDFSQFEGSEARRTLAAMSGPVLELPELDPATMYAIDRSGRSFWAAIHSNEGEGALRPLERRRVKMWLDRFYTQLEALSGSI